MIRKLYYFARWPLFVGAVLGLLIGNILAYKKSAEASDNAKSAADSAAAAAFESELNTDAISQAVKDINNKIDDSTLILCKIVLRGTVELTAEEEADIERICQEQITPTTPPTLRPNNPAPRPATQSNQAQSVDPSGNNEGNGGDKQSLPERAIKLVCDKLKPIGVC